MPEKCAKENGPFKSDSGVFLFIMPFIQSFIKYQIYKIRIVAVFVLLIGAFQEQQRQQQQQEKFAALTILQKANSNHTHSER